MLKKLLMGMMLGVLAGAVQADEASVRAGLAKLLPDLTPDSVTKTSVPGLYEVVFGSKLVYVSEDGRFLIQGQVIDMDNRENLTENRLTGIRAGLMKTMSEDKMVIFGPKDAKHTITVFTDIDCGYCRKLHRDMDAFNEAGIRVRYMFFPRAGVGSPSYKKAVSVWCADDRKQALTDAKSGKPIEEKTCDNPVDEHMALARQFGVNGTPTIIMEDGQVMPGYAPPKYLKKMLDGDTGE